MASNKQPIEQKLISNDKNGFSECIVHISLDVRNNLLFFLNLKCQ